MVREKWYKSGSELVQQKPYRFGGYRLIGTTEIIQVKRMQVNWYNSLTARSRRATGEVHVVNWHNRSGTCEVDVG